MLVRCVACRNELRAQDSDAGKVVKCPACGQKLRLPAAPPPPLYSAETAINYEVPLPQPSSAAFVEDQPKFTAYGGTPDAVPPPSKRSCPACAERVPKNAYDCPFCGEELPDDRPKKEKERPIYDEAWMRTASGDLELHDYIFAIMCPGFFIGCWWLPMFFIWDEGPKAKKMMLVSGAASLFYLLLYLTIQAFK